MGRLASVAVSIALVAGGACRKPAPVADAGASAPRPVKLVALPSGAKNPLWARLPREAAVVLLVPRLAEAGRGLDRHLGPVARALGHSLKPGAAWRKLTGFFDPFAGAARQRWGVDGKGAFAAAILPSAEATLLLVPVSDAARFHQRLGESVRAGAGGAVTEKSSEGITTYRVGGRAVVAHARKGGFVLLAVPRAGADPRTSLLRLTQVRPTESLLQDPDFRTSLAPLGSTGHAVLYLSGEGLYQLQTRRAAALLEQEKASLRRIFNVIRGVAVSLRLDEAGPALSAYVALGEAESWKSVLPPGGGFALGAFLAADAPLALRVSVGGPALVERLLSLAPRTRAQLDRMGGALERRLGIQLYRDVLQNLTGRFAFGLLDVEPDLLAAARDPARRSSALASLQLILAARLRNAGGLARSLAAAALRKPPAPGRSAPQLLRQQRGKLTWYLLRSRGRVLASLALVGDVLLATLGKAAMEKTLDLVEGKGKSLWAQLPAATRAVLGGKDQLVLYVDGKRLQAVLEGIDFKPLGTAGAALRKLLMSAVPAIVGQRLMARGRFDGQGVRIILTRPHR